MNSKNQIIAGDIRPLKIENSEAIRPLHNALPKVSLMEATLANRAYASATTSLDGARFNWKKTAQQLQFTTRIRLKSSKQNYFCWLEPLAHFSPIFSSAAPGWPDNVNCQLFEIAFGPLIDILAGKIGTPLHVTEVDEVTANQPDFYLDGREARFIHFTYNAHDNATDFHGLLDGGGIAQLFASTEAAAPTVPIQKITLQWRMSLGRTLLSPSELGELEVGDVLLPRRSLHPDRLEIDLLASGRWRVAQAILQDDKLIFADIDLGKMMENVETKKIITESDQSAEAGNLQHNDAMLDSLDIELTFDIGKVHIPLSDLKSLAAGSILSLGENPARHPVTIRCNDAILGRAELVLVGEELGVRIVSWGTNA